MPQVRESAAFLGGCSSCLEPNPQGQGSCLQWEASPGFWDGLS